MSKRKEPKDERILRMKAAFDRTVRWEHPAPAKRQIKQQNRRYSR